MTTYVAEQPAITVGTAKSHVHHILEKMGMESRKINELVKDNIEQWATRLGLSSVWKEMLNNVS